METEEKKKNILISFSNPVFLKRLREELQLIIETDDQKSALKFFKILEKAINEYRSDLINLGDIYNWCQNAIIKAKFIALPLLAESEVISLLKNNFCRQFEIELYNILEKIYSKQINIDVYEDRDKFKEEVRQAILENKEIIISKTKAKTISDWLKDYNVKLGTGPVPNFKKIQYFTELDRIKELSETEKNRLKVLFDFYERLKASSLSPEGFEEDVPIEIDGGLYLFKQGVLEPLDDNARKARTVSGPPKTIEEKKIEELKVMQAKMEKEGLEKKYVDQAGIEAQRKIEDLKIMANKYATGSLERRAVEEEIGKLEKK
jgi:hypothetical protein